MLEEKGEGRIMSDERRREEILEEEEEGRENE